MSLRIRDREDSHNVYVLYSDLLFNLLILFTLFVLALVLRFNNSLQQVAAQRAELNKTRAAMTTPAKDLATQLLAAQKDRDAQTQRAAALEQDLNSTKRDLARAMQANAVATSIEARAQQVADAKLVGIARQLSIAAGANRFTGRTGATSLCVAVDLTGNVPRYVLMPASEFNSAHSQLDGESEAEQDRRSARILNELSRKGTRFTLEELSGLFRGLQTRDGRNGKADDGTDEGTLYFHFSGRATFAATGCLDEDGHVDETRLPAAVRRQVSDGTFAARHTRLIDALLTARDQLRAGNPPDTLPVLSFSTNGNDRTTLRIGNVVYRLEQVRQIVRAFGDGGVILQYVPQTDELCPDWITQQLLTPTGHTNAVPDGDELRRLQQQIRATR